MALTLPGALRRHLLRVLVGVEVVDAGAIPVIVAAGTSGTGPHRFLTRTLLPTVAKSLLLLALGAVFRAQLPLLHPQDRRAAHAVAGCAYLLLTRLRETRLQGAQL